MKCVFEMLFHVVMHGSHDGIGLEHAVDIGVNWLRMTDTVCRHNGDEDDDDDVC